MRFQMIDREPDAFQQPVAPRKIEAMDARAFGAGTRGSRRRPAEERYDLPPARSAEASLLVAF